MEIRVTTDLKHVVYRNSELCWLDMHIVNVP